MKTTANISYRCGCMLTREVDYDGRRGEAGRLEAIETAKRMYGDGELRCTECEYRRKLALAEGVYAPRWNHSDVFIRAVRRAAAVTGGEVAISPKSESTYVTFTSGAWRIAYHPWPGEAASLLSERRVGRYYIARLVPDWLEAETANNPGGSREGAKQDAY